MQNEAGPQPKSLEKQVEVPRLSQEFFQVQAEYAAAASRITGEKFEDCVHKYTNLFMTIVDGDKDITKGETAFDQFIKKSVNVIAMGDMRAVAQYAKEEYDRPKEKISEPEHSGCFSYDIRESSQPGEPREIRVHFDNKDTDGGKPLSDDKLEKRKSELLDLFSQIRSTYPGEDFVVTGASWLYNIRQYRELFPEAYQKSLDVPGAPALTKAFLQNMAVWGQFLKADASVNRALWNEFKAKIDAARTEAELLDAFKAKVLTAHAPISAFYRELDKALEKK